MSVELDLETAGVAAVTAAMASGATTSVGLVEAYLDRIATLNPLVNAIRCLAPDALERAAALDAERAEGRVRGPLHGVPVLVKDNIDVAGLPTTAGSLALEHSVPDRDAEVVVRLREAGAVVLGKTNLTEMANCMAEDMPSGYSALGGQVLNPYDLRRDPSGSSSGSGAAAALGLATVTVGTETEGSILSPAYYQSLVGLKPTLGLVPGGGILPIAVSLDCAGPMCRTVADAAALLGVLAGETYGEGSGPDTLRGVRLAVPPEPGNLHEQDQELFRAALDVLRERGAVLVEVRRCRRPSRHRCALRVRPRCRRLPRDPPRGGADPDHARARRVERRARRPGAQVRAGAARAGTGRRPRRRARGVRRAAGPRPGGRGRARHRRDPRGRGRRGDRLPRAGTAAGFAARAGYPSMVVPAGYRREGRWPLGSDFVGPSRSEGLLLSLGAAYEEAAQVRRPPSEINPSLFRGVAGSPATG